MTTHIHFLRRISPLLQSIPSRRKPGEFFIVGHDRLDAINFDDYYTAYKLIAYYLAYLDLKLE